MNGWQASDWATLIAAVAAAVVSILNAFRGQAIERKLDQHEENATCRAVLRGEQIEKEGDDGEE